MNENHTVAYLRQRSSWIMIGFLIGSVLGGLQPTLHAIERPAGLAYLQLILQMGIAFAIVSLFVASYLDLRRRVQMKFGQQAPISSRSPHPTIHDPTRKK